jgi:hypothetical protein
LLINPVFVFHYFFGGSVGVDAGVGNAGFRCTGVIAGGFDPSFNGVSGLGFVPAVLFFSNSSLIGFTF